MTICCTRSLLFVFFLLVVHLLACSRKDTLFTQLPSGESGIHFINAVTDQTSDPSPISEFSFMGGGIGIGDFNRDGLQDIYFAGNQSGSKLYLNRGNLRFEDVTEQAGAGTHDWATGVSVADVNGDGYDDIYVCTYGKDLLHRSPNLLFINSGKGTFREEAAAYGLADTSYSSQAAFLDYDKDGDLDMYLLNYRLNGRNANAIAARDLRGTSPANDRLYRNDGKVPGIAHPHFSDVSLAAGIKEDGYGLGVCISDVNGDNWPDIYVSNDFLSNDELWLNNRNGTFTNRISTAVRHQSYSAMGADAADINNDGLPDITTLDMMPEQNHRKKESFSFMNYERYEMERSYGYDPEFARNMLQLNQGNLPGKDTAVPFFSERGQLASISETDWSWSVLMADFNNDGWKDMHITNGIGRDYINSDFLQYSAGVDGAGMSPAEKEQAINEKLRKIEPVLLGNYLFLNNHDARFTDISSRAGVDKPSLSNGAAYADLDNDGDLDLVVSNINEEAFIMINHTIDGKVPSDKQFLHISLQGSGMNTCGLGSKVWVWSRGRAQLQEQNPVRGYLSTVDPTLLFGLDSALYADSVVVVWPDDRMQTLTHIRAGSHLVLQQDQATATYRPQQPPAAYLFTEVTSAENLPYKHLDVSFNDYAEQRLLPQKFSQAGPPLAWGDVNGDGTQDLYAGGGFNSDGRFFLQQQNGSFQPHAFLLKDHFAEETAVLLFDADGDGDPDLLTAYGDMRFDDTSAFYQPRLFLNDGKGNFSNDPKAIPAPVRTIASCIRAADWDGDGDLDLFIGGRVTKQYPSPPRSFLLQNNGGVFRDVTHELAPALEHAGMITDAVWTHADADHRPELIIAGEWMPLKIFSFTNGRFREKIDAFPKGISGLWRSLVAADLDGDGDEDLVAGNLGLNCRYHVSQTEPMKLFAKDLDRNGSLDPVPFYFIREGEGRQLFPAINRDALAEQVPAIKKKFLEHNAFAQATFPDLFPDTSGMLELTCDEMASCWFENTGKGRFVPHPLPLEAQVAPVNAIVCEDMDGDGRKDLLLAGNEYQAEVVTGRYDASYGLFLKGTATGFRPVQPVTSGLVMNGDVRSMALIRRAQGALLVAGINNDSLRTWKVNSLKKITQNTEYNL